MLTPERITRTFLVMADTLNSRVAANIRAELARRDVPKAEFAEALQWPRSVLGDMLAGRTKITLDKLEQIADLLELAPTHFFHT